MKETKKSNMSKKCPKCDSKDIHITYYPAPTDNMATCYGCGYADLAERFPEQTLFDTITASPEVLARSLCGTIQIGCLSGYYSMLTGRYYRSMEKAVADTIKKLKKATK